jgi:hypothetical protein|tara:strand:- start:3703 stop:3867 length:165 start_codon:yes stop_codon:yes gene_type:complete
MLLSLEVQTFADFSVGKTFELMAGPTQAGEIMDLTSGSVASRHSIPEISDNSVA